MMARARWRSCFLLCEAAARKDSKKSKKKSRTAAIAREPLKMEERKPQEDNKDGHEGYQLVPVSEEGEPLTMTRGTATHLFIAHDSEAYLGRDASHGIADKRVSRNQLRFSTKDIKDGVRVTMVNN